MTKETILASHVFGKNKMDLSSPAPILKAMEKYAQQQATGFAEWMRKMDVNISINDRHWYIPTKKDELGLGEICTDEQLYSKYLESLK